MAYEAVVAFRYAIDESRRMTQLGRPALPPIPQALQGLDHLVVCDDFIVQDSAGMKAARRWVERGGPVVQAPERRGFGRGLIENSIPYELDGRVALTIPREGVCCQIDFPLRPATSPVTRYEPGS